MIGIQRSEPVAGLKRKSTRRELLNQAIRQVNDLLDNLGADLTHDDLKQMAGFGAIKRPENREDMGRYVNEAIAFYVQIAQIMEKK